MTKCITGDNIISALALVAQLDRVLDYESRGQGFESLLAHQEKPIPKRVSVFFLLWKGTRTREGRCVKQTVRWTVCSKRELERQRKPVSMQGEAEADGNPPTRSSAAPCVSSTNEKLFTVVPIFRVSRMSSRPRGTTKVVPFLFIMIF